MLANELLPKCLPNSPGCVGTGQVSWGRRRAELLGTWLSSRLRIRARKDPRSSLCLRCWLSSGKRVAVGSERLHSVQHVAWEALT